MGRIKQLYPSGWIVMFPSLVFFDSFRERSFALIIITWLLLFRIAMSAFVSSICFGYKFEFGSNSASLMMFALDGIVMSMHFSEYGGKMISFVNRTGSWQFDGRMNEAVASIRRCPFVTSICCCGESMITLFLLIQSFPSNRSVTRFIATSATMIVLCPWIWISNWISPMMSIDELLADWCDLLLKTSALCVIFFNRCWLMMVTADPVSTMAEWRFLFTCTLM